MFDLFNLGKKSKKKIKLNIKKRHTKKNKKGGRNPKPKSTYSLDDKQYELLARASSNRKDKRVNQIFNDKTPEVEKNNHSISYVNSKIKKGGNPPPISEEQQRQRKAIQQITRRTMLTPEERTIMERNLQEMSAEHFEPRNNYIEDYSVNNRKDNYNSSVIDTLIDEIKENNEIIRARKIAKATVKSFSKKGGKNKTRKRGGSEFDISTGSKHNTPPNLLATLEEGLMDQFKKDITVKTDEVKEKIINAIRIETEKKLKSKYMDEKIKYLKNIFKDTDKDTLIEIAQQLVDDDLKSPNSAISSEIETQTNYNVENNELFKKMIHSIDDNDPTSSATAAVNTATRGIQDNILDRTFRVQELDEQLEKVKLDDELEKVNNIEELQKIIGKLEYLKKLHDNDLENVEFSRKKLKSAYLSPSIKSVPKSEQGRQSRIKDMMEKSEMYQKQNQIKNNVIDQSTELHDELKNEEILFNNIFSKISKMQSIDEIMENLGLDDESNSPSLKSPSKKKKGNNKGKKKGGSGEDPDFIMKPQSEFFNYTNYSSHTPSSSSSSTSPELQVEKPNNNEENKRRIVKQMQILKVIERLRDEPELEGQKFSEEQLRIMAEEIVEGENNIDYIANEIHQTTIQLDVLIDSIRQAILVFKDKLQELKEHPKTIICEKDIDKHGSITSTDYDEYKKQLDTIKKIKEKVIKEDKDVMADIKRADDTFELNLNYSEKRDEYLKQIKILIDAADEFIQMVEPELDFMKQLQFKKENDIAKKNENELLASIAEENKKDKSKSSKNKTKKKGKKK